MPKEIRYKTNQTISQKSKESADIQKTIEKEVISNTNNIGPQQPNASENVGICHLIECTCILPQYLNSKQPVFHKFITFSVIDENDTITQKYSQCNNCGAIHKIVDICKSEIMRGKEELSSVVTKNDLAFSIPKQLVELLNEYKCDVHIWEYVKFILDNEKWGSYVIIKSEELDGKKIGKFLVINSETKFGISTFEETVEYSTN
jgi:hypothetical protein